MHRENRVEYPGKKLIQHTVKQLMVLAEGICGHWPQMQYRCELSLPGRQERKKAETVPLLQPTSTRPRPQGKEGAAELGEGPEQLIFLFLFLYSVCASEGTPRYLYQQNYSSPYTRERHGALIAEIFSFFLLVFITFSVHAPAVGWAARQWTTAIMKNERREDTMCNA